ncbi:MAG: hypothetical protein QNJ06_06310 [Kiloniellales bacterium]|nr:hypothetical protein [Kiloniellales bacterium]
MRRHGTLGGPAAIGLLTTLLTLVLIAMGTGTAAACGPDSDCRLGDRTYRIRMPAGHNGSGSVGAIMYMHGYRGTAAGIMRNKAFGKAVSDLGLALVAPKSLGDDWSIPNAPREYTDDFAFFDRLLEDITTRFAIDPKRIMATGFSAGGMMVWNLACQRGESFAGFAPIAGTFWAPIPQSCPSQPVHLLHTHGTDDKIVPLRGRPIQKTHQGDVYKALSLFGEAGNFGDVEAYEDLDLTCERRLNPDGRALELCLHAGGHSFKSKYVVRAWRELEALGAMD